MSTAASERPAAGSIRVLVWCRIDPAAHDRLVEAFESIGASLQGVPGYLSSELLQVSGAADRFGVLSAWTDWDRFNVWEQGQVHRDQTSPLREFQDRSLSRTFEIMTVLRVAESRSLEPH